MAKWWNQAQEIEKLRQQLKQQANIINQMKNQLQQAGLAVNNPHGVSDEEQALINEGKQVHAIKAYRERTGADLLTAKNAIEAAAK